MREIPLISSGYRQIQPDLRPFSLALNLKNSDDMPLKECAVLGDFEGYLPLLKKYDTRGPRYTSYPTAPYFQSDFPPSSWQEALDSLRGKRLSLYVHIPYCRNLCWYCGCNMEVNRKPEAMSSYLGHLKMEMARTIANLKDPGPVKQLHFGGGSPNLLSPHQLTELMAFMRQNFKIDNDAEISLEADPRLLTQDFVMALRDSGFNRVSMGIQDFNEKVQRAIHRIQPFDLVAEKAAMLHQAGFTGINMDVMYGLPHQNPGSFKETLDQVLQIQPQRIALFNYAHLPQLKPHMKLIDAGDIPEPETKFQLFWLAKQAFQAAGYGFIGMDHFAMQNDPLAVAKKSGDLHRNFQGYTTHAGLEMLGFGASAISFLNHCYVQNQSLSKVYQQCLQEGRTTIARGMLLSSDDRFRGAIIQRLFCENTIDVHAIEAAGGKAFNHLFPGATARLDAMAADGLLTPACNGWEVTELGQILLRNIAMVFDGYLGKCSVGPKPLYSKTL